jgi:hypothetical protein
MVGQLFDDVLQFVGVATAAFLLFYQWVVEAAPPHSLRVKAFAALTQGGGRVCSGCSLCCCDLRHGKDGMANCIIGHFWCVSGSRRHALRLCLVIALHGC